MQDLDDPVSAVEKGEGEPQPNALTAAVSNLELLPEIRVEGEWACADVVTCQAVGSEEDRLLVGNAAVGGIIGFGGPAGEQRHQAENAQHWNQGEADQLHLDAGRF
jgi:hypothetical protein